MVCCASCYAQDKTNTSYFDVNYFKGHIAEHNKTLLHLIKDRPEGVILSWNKQTYGNKDWEQRFNYPDYGASFVYQDLKNDVLGNNYAVYGHYNFYFFKRNVLLRIAQGVAYNTNPYDRVTNSKNIAFGSSILSSTYLMLNYKKEYIIDRFGLQAGLFLVHYSNGSIKAPNTSTNTIAFNVGLTYSLESKPLNYIKTINREADKAYKERIKYNLIFRTGINQSDVIGSSQFPFYVASMYADKRINKVSALQFGTDVFFSNFLKAHIAFKGASFPEEAVSGDEDYRRVGVFAGHELFINKLSVISQVGYYVYYPFDFEGRVYLRAGLKYYFTNRFFTNIAIKSHGAKAEAIEFGIGVRL